MIALAQRHPTWMLGFLDAVGWSRLAQPGLHAWTAADDPPLHLVERAVAPDAPDPKALAGYGALPRQAGQPDPLWLRFVEGRPVSAVSHDPGPRRGLCASGAATRRSRPARSGQ